MIEADDLHIGQPYADTRVYVLDGALQPCPVGVTGELYIAGGFLARGYLRRPALTAERFVANPFAIDPGERLYRTGDLAAWRDDGKLLFHGRADQQVKIRGVRVEPGEIEAALVREADVAQAAVVVADRAGERRLIAYVVPNRRGDGAQAPIDLRALRQTLAASLPEALVPAAFVVLDALPLTRNGQLDRAALPAPLETGLAASYVPPTTAEEHLLCELIAALVGRTAVGVGDHFFHLGGHSLLATRLVTQVRSRLGRDLPLRTIFDTPVVGDLARAVRALAKTENERPVVPDPGSMFEPFPLTPVQEAYWLGRQRLVALGDVACHLYVEFRFRRLDVARLTGAWREVIARRPMLRAVIDRDGRQRFLAEVPPLVIPFVDVRAGSGDVDAAVRAVRDAMSHQVLPSDRWPLFDARVTRAADDDWRLHLSLDALILDGESINRFLQEIFDRYDGRRPADSGPAAHVTFRDYVLHRQTLVASETRARAYWTARIGTSPPARALPLAIDPARLADQRLGGQHARLDPEAWRSIRAFAAAAGLTAASVLLTAYAEVVGTWARSDDFTLTHRRRSPPAAPEVADMLGVSPTSRRSKFAVPRAARFSTVPERSSANWRRISIIET